MIMEPENFIDYYNYEAEDLKAENVIFQAYLSAFFRHQAYIYNLYNTGKIYESQATERINAAWEKVKVIKKDLQYQLNSHNYDANTQFYLVKTRDFCLNLEDRLGLWN
ncbi:DUF7219 family protein [Calothrix sp. NIES-2098]|uniref:DUF7219 family protein n=1 Tax=Calothrix sp. NIES-2098 TaxID=1954171 RepID=UPI000B60F999|nr:hypothetical protein NIES2098_47430 [Calothrix sp. NIES-2098]